MKWFQHARKRQPGIRFQTFDDLAILILQQQNYQFTQITEEERFFFFCEILDKANTYNSYKELVQQAKAYAETYGQLKRLGLTIEQTPRPLLDLQPIFKKYEDVYRDAKGFMDPENRIFKAVELGRHLTEFPLSHVVIDGYSDFSPVQYSLIQYLLASAVPVTIYLPEFKTPLINITVSTLKTMGFTTYNEELSFLDRTICKKKERTSATTIEEEIHGVLDSIDKQRNGNRYDQYGLVFVNEEIYLPELERISLSKRIPIKKVINKSLTETGIFAFITIILQQHVPQQTKWEQVHLVDSVAKLCFIEPTKYNQIKEQFIANREICHDDVCSIVASIVDYQQSLEEKQTIRKYNESLLGLLDKLPLPSTWKQIIKTKSSKQIKAVALELRAFNTLIEFLRYSLDDEKPLPIQSVNVHLDTYQVWLLSRLEHERLYIDRAPHDGIEIYSFRDAPIFKGKHLFVLGLNEGEFPKQTKLSGYFQERYVDEIDSPYPLPLASYFRLKDDAAFAQLEYIATYLSFSYVEGMNPNQPMLPSKYIVDSTLYVKPTNYSSINRLNNNTYVSDDELDEKLAYHAGIGKILKQEPVILKQFRRNLAYLEKGTERISAKWETSLLSSNISITKLERYAACPFRYSLEQVLKVEPPIEKQTKIDPRETGNMLHRIIEEFYKEVKGRPFKDLQIFYNNKAEEKLETIFEKEWEVIVQKHYELSRRILNKEKEEWWKKLRKWLAAEKHRFWENDQIAEMSIFRIEEPVQLSIDMPNNEPLVLTGKIDRIDIDEHGFVIYDYKSSNKNLDFENEIPSGIVLQVPLYMMALEQEFNEGRFKAHVIKKAEPIGGGYISVKDPNLRNKNTVWIDESHKMRFEPNVKIKPNIERINSETLINDYQFPALIEKLWRGTATDFSVKPYSSASCKYCNYKMICRVTTEKHGKE